MLQGRNHHFGRHLGRHFGGQQCANAVTCHVIFPQSATEIRPKKGPANQANTAQVKTDLRILDALGYLPLSASGGALLFHLLRKLSERARVIITTNQCFREWASVFGGAKMSTALRAPLTRRGRILVTCNDSYRFKASFETAKKKRKETPPLTAR